MATVTLDYLYLHRASDPSEFLALDLDAETVTKSKSGEVRRLASGRRRAVVRSGSSLSISVELQMVTRSDREVVEAWVAEGALLMLRDPRGRVVWGHAFGVETVESALLVDEGEAADLTFTFETVTFSEEV